MNAPHTDHAVSNFAAPNGFVSIRDGELARQRVFKDDFRRAEPDLYERALAAFVGLKVASQELENAKAALVSACPQGKVSDLLFALEADARARLKESAKAPTVSQIAKQTGPSIEPEPVLEAKPADKAQQPIKFGGRELAGVQGRKGKR